jgi:hypothetical protein
MKREPIWDLSNIRRVYVTMTPACNNAKVLVRIGMSAGDKPLTEVTRYVWGLDHWRTLGLDVMKFTEDAIYCAEVEIMDLQTMMDGDPEPLVSPDDPSNAPS